MSEMSFSFQSPKMTDEEFWQQLRDLDELQEELPDFSGFSIKAKMSTGKEVTVPFVRFAKAMPRKAS